MRPLAKEPIERVGEESTKYERWSANITWHYSRPVTQLKVINSAGAVVPKPLGFGRQFNPSCTSCHLISEGG